MSTRRTDPEPTIEITAEDIAREREPVAWSDYFTRDGASFRCIRHDWLDEEGGGICPSCARYAFNAALAAEPAR